MFKTKTPAKDGKPLEQSSNSLLNAKQSVQHYYNANNELAKTITNTEEGFHLTTITTHYKYDAFGRRIAKNSKTQVKTKLINRQYSRIRKYHIQEEKTVSSQVSFLWDGNRQIQEYKENLVFTTMYEHNSFEPVARLVWSINKVEDSSSHIHVYHYHNDHLGTPNELSDKEGDIVWLADYKAWGGVAKNIYIPQTIDGIEVNETDLQPIRFQGQFIDQETGLHYNRFRYYDNDLGMFISRDPIGLMGGNNTFQYAPNPTGWIDPFRLKKCPSISSRMKNAGLHGLPSKGTYRYIPPRNYDPCNPLPKGRNGGYIDRFENEWVQGPYHGDPSKPFSKEWDVQLSTVGEGKWNIRGGASKSKSKGYNYYINVRPDGMKSH